MTINDYSKEVDKIIATGKPMVEQFMDLMGLLDVTFIDENQTSNGRLHQLTKSDSSKKHDKSVQDKQTTEKSSAVENNRIKKKRKSSQNEVSDCCGAKVLTVQGYPKDEGTHYWQCSKCGAPCNIMDRDGSQTKRKRDATTGSTATVHYNWEKDFELWCDVTEVDRVSRESIKGFITQLLGKILKHNQDDMTCLYDYDGIAQEVIDLVKK